ncbi:MAG: hypothetical protein U5O16_41945, partial [Rhodococcus sp. (in: high G+C Gram-positive bacteria)]|uniref:hypothetical protein n=1 Tax=Rhodococcus sp. TaxID=1831 RepID=UPI002AD69EB3|nr:hypothetical protein [Rhodococcus sp. (in: high G+C Gram-positive bacteria)]
MRAALAHRRKSATQDPGTSKRAAPVPQPAGGAPGYPERGSLAQSGRVASASSAAALGSRSEAGDDRTSRSCS